MKRDKYPKQPIIAVKLNKWKKKVLLFYEKTTINKSLREYPKQIANIFNLCWNFSVDVFAKHSADIILFYLKWKSKHVMNIIFKPLLFISFKWHLNLQYYLIYVFWRTVAFYFLLWSANYGTFLFIHFHLCKYCSETFSQKLVFHITDKCKIDGT